jgi:hypothetical protein
MACNVLCQRAATGHRFRGSFLAFRNGKRELLCASRVRRAVGREPGNPSLSGS